ncbi:MAG: NADH-quinone oxidoreductase subunit M [Zetaproteobacteria bacterium CG_4_9_14_3_um_filter_49_83]|nr:MAG: NADH-quinone oxidoreductase subunit M [Zetaproteobacteria bacterium CG1_02_49_23]PIQ30500.1 MAG: NADH-quinone oxidoreductase subunit M [Zetaproteobacteria bacterium CG17_big_fil_post_rev_8_21_14_2_50_50_13]PIV31603.1 MAG: NADH-quinone oxidoreductase subunit M [Zetaproteobacteria bacterium CG02_land_8_20_14_3_00_50_9]PIY55323.1 MAG: NADH-quinone oxidoreductase subunit M [Zetaproteobacteria bacterium CG_4_10_14_0_8_um_filter_49_80]PJA36144.1 MAG: NADH-quinone oxidoreductase subunit M [Zet
MLEFPILSLSIFLPAIGAIFIWLFVKGDNAVRWSSLIVSILTFLVTLPLWLKFDTSTAHMQFEELHPWIETYHINYQLGVDGISMPFILLTSLLTVICIVSAWECITVRVKEYMLAFLILETTLIGVFSALDAVLFYFFWEAMLIPMYLIIGIWGGKNRVYATLKFFLYTLAGSVLMLIALLAMYFKAGETFSMLDFMAYPFDFTWQFWIWIAFFIAFAVKVPMWPVHTWLPDAHTEAPTAGSVILAGILLKMGAYGFLRFSLPMLPDASQYFVPFVVALSLIAIIYISLVAMMQKDMKRLIAYSSIAHMGFVTLGTFMFTQQAIEGALFGMISHGFVAAALFLCVGVMYDRLHTREIGDYGGVVNVMPVFAAVMMLFCMANVALPGASSFIGEIMVLIGTFNPSDVAQANLSISTKWIAIAATSSVVLSACYTLWMYKRVVFGALTKDSVKTMQDMNVREFSYFVPLIILVVWLGFYPMPVLDVMHASALHLVEQSTASKLDAAAALAEHAGAAMQHAKGH